MKTGMEMMMSSIVSSLGIDPAEIQKMIQQFTDHMKSIDKRLESLEERIKHMDSKIDFLCMSEHKNREDANGTRAGS